MQEGIVFQTAKGTPATDTYRIASVFGRQHEDVLRAYDALRFVPHFRERNFAVGNYLDVNNEPQRIIMMTRTGFRSLVCTFSGKDYAQLKRKFMAAFDKLEAQLRGKDQPLHALPLVGLTEREAQVKSETQFAEHLLRWPGGSKALVSYHHHIMRCLTGKSPSEYVQAGVNAGVCSASISGLELLRQMEPAKAATAAFLHDQLRRGKSLAQMTKAGIHLVLPRAFEALLQAGITPAELQS